MSERMSPYYNSESDWQLRPQASYPVQPGPYNPPRQAPGYQYPNAMPPQPYPGALPAQPYPGALPAQPSPYQNPYAPAYAAPQPPPPYQVSAQPVNINIVNQQNGYMPQEMYDPYSGVARSALWLGITAVTVWIIPFIGSLTSLICAIIGLINGIRGLKSVTRKGSAIAGLILSCIALACIVLGILVFGATLLALLGMHSTPATTQPAP